MTLLQERVETVEEHLDSLETIFGRFMTQTGATLLRLERNAERDRREWRERFEQDRAEWQVRFDKEQRRLEEQRAEEQRMRAEQRAEDQRKLEEQRAEWQARFDKEKSEREEARKADNREWNQRWGELANRLGTFAEDIVAPNMPRIARDYFGITDIEDFMVRRKVRNKKDRTKQHEFDIIVVGAQKVVVNETKSTPRINYIDDFAKALSEIEDYFPEYAGRVIISVFASLYLPDDILTYLTRRKIYAMGLGEETMDLLNFTRLHPENA